MHRGSGERIAGILRATGALAAGLWFCCFGAIAQTPDNCKGQADSLSRIQCSGVLRVGVRNNYPPFAHGDARSPRGFEIDLARQLAAAIGVVPQFTVVTPANRIALLGEGRIDMVVATMGHTSQRDREALFIRPHYYRSQTAVVGRRELGLLDLDSLRGSTVCVTLGNSTNAELITHGARLMLFDSAPRLVDGLRQGGCSLVAQDDTFFATYFRQPAFDAAYQVKFDFAPLPWGAAVAREGGQRLAAALAQAMRQMHVDGSLEALAKTHGVESIFLADQRALWSSGRCSADSGLADPLCVLPPRDSQLAPTVIAPAVDRIEQGIKEASGIKVTLAMLKSRVALDLFIDGILFSLVLVAGAVAATYGMALVFGLALSSRHGWLRWPMRCLLWMMQSTPMILLMILAGVVVSAFGAVTAYSALAGAIVVLGLFNGSNAGQAVAESMVTLRAETPNARVPMSAAVRRSSAQILAFVVNATRGSPAASVIGVPELLSALTDIASFSSERVTTYTLLLMFYMLVVALVVRLGHVWQARLAHGWAARA